MPVARGAEDRNAAGCCLGANDGRGSARILRRWRRGIGNPTAYTEVGPQTGSAVKIRLSPSVHRRAMMQQKLG